MSAMLALRRWIVCECWLRPPEVTRGRWRSAAVAFGPAEPGRTDPAQQLPGVDGHGAGRNQQLVAVAGNVVVVVVEAALGNAIGPRERVQLGVGYVADQVRPDPA